MLMMVKNSLCKSAKQRSLLERAGHLPLGPGKPAPASPALGKGGGSPREIPLGSQAVFIYPHHQTRAHTNVMDVGTEAQREKSNSHGSCCGAKPQPGCGHPAGLQRLPLMPKGTQGKFLMAGPAAPPHPVSHPLAPPKRGGRSAGPARTAPKPCSRPYLAACRPAGPTGKRPSRERWKSPPPASWGSASASARQPST